MGYRIDYSQSSKRSIEKKRTSAIALFAVFFFLFFLLLTGMFWQQGAKILREILLPGDAAVTAAALQDLTLALKTGESFSNALTDFCLQVIQGAGLHFG